jgi:phosphocarrier protein FPr/phosphocarrier protein
LTEVAQIPLSGAHTAEAGLQTIRAPIAGWLEPLDEVNDPVFAGRVLGDGFAVDPTEAVLRAPFDGVVTSVHRARHAVTLRADGGAEVLMHIGLDTVALKGEGFDVHVAIGDRVACGDPLIGFDIDVLAQIAKSLVVPVIVTNGEEFAVSVPSFGREVAAGEPVGTIRPAGTAAPIPAVDTTSGEVFRAVVAIRDPNGIHARPAGVVAEVARAAAAKVTLSLGERRADARSPVALMLLDAHCGDALAVEVIGRDAAAVGRRIIETIGAEVAVPAARPATVPAARPEAPIAPTPIATGRNRLLEGICGAPGLAVGTAVRIVRTEIEVAEAGEGIEPELAHLRRALDATVDELRGTIAAQGPAAGQQAEILAAHLSFVEDPDLQNAADALIRDGKSAAFAWKATVDRQVAALRALGNPVLAERASDLEDIRHRVLLILTGRTETIRELPADAVVFADDLLPSQFGDLDLSRVVALCLARGGPTAHVSILAAARGLPTVVAIGPDALAVADGESVVVDADAGRVEIAPRADEIAATRAAAQKRRARAAADRAATHAEARMSDGTRIEVFANLGGPADVAVALENGAEGCGLLRSEFLFLDRTTAPTEDEQFLRYQGVATALDGRPLIIRTLDAGADKDVPYVGLPKEENPALGLRGIRIGLIRPELLATQIRAILRVEPFGRARLLLPMVATLDDLRMVRGIVEREAKALGRVEPIELGIMIEVPSAALVSAHFAAEADFFSIGTNDLTQYTLAMDRTDARLARQLDQFHPAVLRLIAHAVEGARRYDRPVGVCGSLASFPVAAPLLIGLGVTELSVTPGAIAEIKSVVRGLTMDTCAALATQALTLESGDAVRRLLTAARAEA